MSSFTDAQVQQTRSLEVLTLLRINRSFMEFMRKHYGHMPMAGFEPKYAKYGKAGEASSSSDNNTPKSGETATSRRPAGRPDG